MDEIILCGRGVDPLPIKLHREPLRYTVEMVLSERHRVFEDLPYEIYFDPDPGIFNVEVIIDDESIPSVYQEGVVRFCGENRANIFKNTLGFVEIEMVIRYEDYHEERLYADILSVMIKDTSKNHAIDGMLKYIYENQDSILFRSVTFSSIDEDYSKTYDDFWSQIQLFEEITKIYEESYGFFKANCRYRLEKEVIPDRIEKLQYVDTKTIQFIVQHPELLRREAVGIRYGNQTFIPDKTLVVQNRITTDTYENQIVLGFLEKMVIEVGTVANSVHEMIQAVSLKQSGVDGYIESASLLYQNALETLQSFLIQLRHIEKKIADLSISYGQILNVTKVSVSVMPRQTAVFMNLPQYHRIYTCIYRCFSKTGYGFEKEKMIFSFRDAPSVYEAYVLVKMLDYIREMGYTVVEARRVTYPRTGPWFHQKNCNNYFVFERDEERITLYYEPIIYCTDSREINGMGLYRNNRISVQSERTGGTGSYYAPDYVLKYEKGEVENYVICDAKFSNYDKVKAQLVPELAYKYLISLSPISQKSTVGGLHVFYALTDNHHRSDSFYDLRPREGREIAPLIQMVPLSESIAYTVQDTHFAELFKSLRG